MFSDSLVDYLDRFSSMQPSHRVQIRGVPMLSRLSSDEEVFGAAWGVGGLAPFSQPGHTYWRIPATL